MSIAVPGMSGASTSLRRDGFVRIPGFVAPGSVGALKAEVERLLVEPLLPGCDRPHNRLVPLRWNDRMVDLILSDPSRRSYLRTAVDAEDLRWISGYVSVKEPQTPPLWWHQDWRCWGHPVSYQMAPVQVALLIYLAETTQENGALRVIPGSHIKGLPIHAVLPEAHAQDDPPLDHPALQDHVHQVTLSMNIGDAVVIDYRLLHGTHANASNERRDSLLLSFTPSWRSLPEDIKAHLIQHTALPSPAERVGGASWESELLPHFWGPRADLELDRVPPSDFVCS